MTKSEDHKTIQIDLTPAEALVLFEFATRFTESESLTIEHEAEARALWGLTAALEKVLVEPFKPEYQALLDAARASLVAEK